MLSDIVSLLQERGPMTPAELGIHFEMDASAMEGMLRMLERKGRVERIPMARCTGCSGCGNADSPFHAYYRIVSSGPHVVSRPLEQSSSKAVRDDHPVRTQGS